MLAIRVGALRISEEIGQRSWFRDVLVEYYACLRKLERRAISR
jgi:hypothetical protein